MEMVDLPTALCSREVYLAFGAVHNVNFTT